MSKETENQVQEKDYYIISCTLKDGSNKRQFADMPVHVNKGMFPEKITLFQFACQMFNIDISENIDSIYSSFAIISIHKFDNESQFNMYTTQPQLPTEDPEVDEDE